MRSPSPAFIGLMSGTSVDGVDGTMVRFDPASPGRPLHIESMAQASRDMPGDLRDLLLALARADKDRLSDIAGVMGALDSIELAALAANRLSDLYAEVVADLQRQVPDTPVLAIGAHGQTIRHRPASGYTLQLFNGARLAALSGLPVACDFRSGDVALGGQGAPLVPLFHRHLLESPDQLRVILNLGGIANLSLLHEGRAAGFDTGPACTLLDAWCHQQRGQLRDEGGRWAATGKVDAALLAHCLQDPYFALPPPKSTGREHFSPAWLQACLHACPNTDRSAADTQASLSALTARSVAAALAAHPAVGAAQAEGRALSVYACGGGVRNTQLMRDISEALRGALGDTVNLHDTQWLGIDPQAMEACAFAWLAWQRWEGQALDARTVTGSSRPTVMGALYLP